MRRLFQIYAGGAQRPLVVLVVSALTCQGSSMGDGFVFAEETPVPDELPITEKHAAGPRSITPSKSLPREFGTVDSPGGTASPRT
ncbi:hypothetical protein C8039_16940 [Halogeometricum sp. wsp3]|nr:hypothetical protein C8039_16940 [Halogeometricum sp. wsp3]